MRLRKPDSKAQLQLVNGDVDAGNAEGDKFFFGQVSRDLSPYCVAVSLLCLCLFGNFVFKCTQSTSPIATLVPTNV